MGDVETFLEHYGVKGMHWGVRRDQSSSSGGGGGGKPASKPKSPAKPKPPASDDAKRAAALKEKSRAGGSKALSNKELQDLVTRMNLESQFSRLSANDTSGAKKFLKNLGEQQAKQLITANTPKLIAAISNRLVKS